MKVKLQFSLGNSIEKLIIDEDIVTLHLDIKEEDSLILIKNIAAEDKAPAISDMDVRGTAQDAL